MAALSFITDHTEQYVQDPKIRRLLLDDSRVVESSLNYINDSWLDLCQASSEVSH